MAMRTDPCIAHAAMLQYTKSHRLKSFVLRIIYPMIYPFIVRDAWVLSRRELSRK